MKKPITFFAAFIFTFLCVAFISSCKKPGDKLPLEPISLIRPDSVISTAFQADVISPVVQITTDRPIDWVMCLCDVDTFIDSVNYVPTYPDTLSFKNLQSLNPRVNLYIDSIGSYIVQSSEIPFTIIRFKVIFQAGSTGAVYGQNYPVGLVTDEKEFIINVQ